MKIPIKKEELYADKTGMVLPKVRLSETKNPLIFRDRKTGTLYSVEKNSFGLSFLSKLNN